MIYVQLLVMVFAAGSIHGVFSSEEVPIQLDQHDYQKESVASAIRLWADGILASLSLKKRSDEVRPRDEPDKPTQLLDHLHGGFALNIEQSKSTYLSKTPIQFQLKRFLTKLAVNPALQTEAMAAFDAFVEKTTNDEISFTISSPQEARTAKVGSFQVNKEQNGHWKVMYATREIEYYPTHLIDITSSTNTSWTESDRSYEYTVSSFGEELLVALPAEP